jgi:SAM-dependent methyltransferase
MTSVHRDQPHSASYFGPQRDFWWNRDYLELLARRWRLEGVRSVLDVGAGVGHWSVLVASVLAPTASVVGVEPDPRSVEQARRRTREAGLAGRCSYAQGAAEALPFEDGNFDLVTCQTLLIHVPDVPAVIKEMRRVTRPGGLVIAAEPNNRASLLVATSADVNESVPARVERIQFALTCERGKVALGEGNNSVGDFLPGLFAEAELTDIETFINDKESALVPPYDSQEQDVLRSAWLDDAAKRRWIWSREEARRFFRAGGGTEHDFDRIWQRRMNEVDRGAKRLEAREFHTAGGGIHYIVRGRRPP